MTYISQKITAHLEPYSAQLCIFAKRAFEPKDLLHSAAVAFLDTGRGKFLVTCHHVWETFLSLRAENPEAVMAAPLGPNSGLLVLDGLEYIDGDRRFLDIAVLRLAEPEVLRSGSKAYYSVERWPHEIARQDELVALIGYPAHYRRVNENSIHFRTVRICDYITRVTDRQFSLRDDGGQRQQFNHEKGMQELEGHLGGMSGSPVFSPRRGSFELIGFVTDGFGTTNGNVLVSHAHFILPDGKLKQLPWN